MRPRALVGLGERAVAELPLAGERFAVVDDRLIEGGIVGDDADGADLAVQTAPLDRRVRHPDQLLAFARQGEAGATGDGRGRAAGSSAKTGM